MAYATPRNESTKKEWEKCKTKRDRILCILNSGRPHSSMMLDMDTDETSCAPVIGGFIVYPDKDLKNYDSNKEAKDVAVKIYEELLDQLKTE